MAFTTKQSRSIIVLGTVISVVPISSTEWTLDAKLAILMFKRAFTNTPIANHFEPAKPIILQTDVSGFATGGILNWYVGCGIPRLVNICSRK
jgi:hypothetical protein